MNYFVKSWLDANVRPVGAVPDPVEPAPVEPDLATGELNDRQKLAMLWAAHPELH
jgi:hypothetical protein